MNPDWQQEFQAWWKERGQRVAEVSGSRAAAKQAWREREKRLSDDAERELRELRGELENAESFVFNITPGRTIKDSCGNLDAQIELLRIRHKEEIERLQAAYDSEKRWANLYHKELQAARNEMEQAREKIQHLTVERDEYRRLYDFRGDVLKTPCANCGCVSSVVKVASGNNGEDEERGVNDD